MVFHYDNTIFEVQKLLDFIKKLLGQSSSEKGFTLIELLVVIAIMGVLMVGALIAINPAQKINQAKDANAKAGADQITSALQSYFTTNQSYPTTLAQLQTAKELQNLPNTPQGAAFGASNYSVYVATGGSVACDGGTTQGGTTNCGAVSVYFTEVAPASAEAPQYCWKSNTGAVTHTAEGAGNCAP
jgi:prepilin-type N-terminal cleavage/methylation domain-containing protein